MDFTADFGRTAADYATHRAGFPDALFDRLARLGVGRPGQRIADLGTGTGTLARGFAARGAKVVGIDPSHELLRQASALAAAEGLELSFREGTAEATGLGDDGIDAVTAGQCWHWFDGEAAFREVGRILKPAGRLAICHFDWLPFAGSLADATEALILKHNPDWPYAGGTGTYPQWIPGAEAAGYTGTESFSFDVDQVYSTAAWRGRIRASAGVGGSLEPDAVAAFDADLAGVMAARFPGDVHAVPHRCWAMVAVAP